MPRSLRAQGAHPQRFALRGAGRQRHDASRGVGHRGGDARATRGDGGSEPVMPFIDNMPEGDYHRHAALGSSGIWNLLDSPATYAYFRDHPSKESDATELGTAIHAYVLEPATFAARYFITPPGFSRAKKE